MLTSTLYNILILILFVFLYFQKKHCFDIQFKKFENPKPNIY
jgi:hypothetical protein